MPKAVHAIATCDTKGEELAYVAQCLKRSGVPVLTVDVGTGGAPVVSADISRKTVAACHPNGAGAVLGLTDRGQAVTAMSQALVRFLTERHRQGLVAGVLGLGGGGGTALITPAMQALPIGVPKLMVSTMTSGNVAPYVGAADIAMMYSVVDVAGLNRVSRIVLANAAHAMSGMVEHSPPSVESRPALSMTMFGVTTPCVTHVRQALEAEGYDCLVFHATGSGGRAMEKLVGDGLVEGVLDITTTEVADEVVGGILSAGPQRFDVIFQRRVPCVMSVGALDMVNFGALDTVPEKFRQRRLHVHNAQVTLMRTMPEENRRIARWIAEKINRAQGPIRLLLPEGGVSMLDAPGQPFYDPEADAALFEELEAKIVQTEHKQIKRLPHHINDPAFAEEIVTAWHQIRPT